MRPSRITPLFFSVFRRAGHPRLFLARAAPLAHGEGRGERNTTRRDCSAARGSGDSDSLPPSSYQTLDGTPRSLLFDPLPLERLHEQWAALMFPGSNAKSGLVSTGMTWSGSHASGVMASAR